MEKVVFRMSLYSLSLYRNCPIDVLWKSMNWFLYNGNIDLNDKVDAWLR